MEEQKLNLTLADGQKELIIREGKAEEIIYPKPVNLSGDIRSVGSFLKVRRENAIGVQVVDIRQAVIVITKKELSIEILLNPESVYGSSVKGVLRISPELAEFGINTKKQWTRKDFRELVKFAKMYFVDKQVYADLMRQLGSLKSEVSYAKGDTEDERGNKEETFVRSVTSNVMDGFKIELPVYENFDEDTVDVEICIGVKDGTLNFWLASVQLAELLKVKGEKILADQLAEAGDLVTIYK